MTVAGDPVANHTATTCAVAGPVHMNDVLDEYLIDAARYAVGPQLRGLISDWYASRKEEERARLMGVFESVRTAGVTNNSTLSDLGVAVRAPDYEARALWPTARRTERGWILLQSKSKGMADLLDAEIRQRGGASQRVMAALGALKYVCRRKNEEHERIVGRYEATYESTPRNGKVPGPAGASKPERIRRRRDVLRAYWDEIGEEEMEWDEMFSMPAGIDSHNVTGYWADCAELGRPASPHDSVLQDFDGIQKEHNALKQRAERARRESEERGHLVGRPPRAIVVEPHRQALKQALVLVVKVLEKRPEASFDTVLRDVQTEERRSGRRPPSRAHVRQAYLQARARRGT